MDNQIDFANAKLPSATQHCLILPLFTRGEFWRKCNLKKSPLFIRLNCVKNDNCLSFLARVGIFSRKSRDRNKNLVEIFIRRQNPKGF